MHRILLDPEWSACVPKIRPLFQYRENKILISVLFAQAAGQTHSAG